MKALDELRRLFGTDCSKEEACKQYRSCTEHWLSLIDVAESEVAERYVELPPDVDDETIHVGDKLVWPDDTATVSELVYNGTSWFAKNLLGDPIHIYNARHYHAPTVEDVLREMLVSIDCTGGALDANALIAEYAAKLQLKEVEQ